MGKMRFAYLAMALMAVSLAGCSAERKLARHFVKAPKPVPIMVMYPSLVHKYNLKTFEYPGIDSLAPVIKDSLLIANSLFLKDVDDETLLKTFTDNFSEALSQQGYRVLPEGSFDSLLATGSSALIVHIAQFSLEEYIHPYRSEEVVYDEVLVLEGIDLNAINFNAWFELSPLNGEERNPVLFASDYLFDQLNGVLRQNLISGKFRFDYTIDTITTGDIEEFTRRFGQKTGLYLYDYLMNRYILQHLPAGYPYQPYYYHYDRSRNLVYPIGDDERFMELE